MAQIHKDPVTYLNEAVIKRGKSGPDGVYLHSITVVAEALADYDYKVSYGPAATVLEGPPDVNIYDWNSLLVSVRANHRQLSHELHLRDFLLQFLVEGGTLNLNVFFPVVETASFPYTILYCQDILRCVADFAGKIPASIRFNIGLAHKSWEDMVEEGEAEETDLNF
jgi:hypothetical protein